MFSHLRYLAVFSLLVMVLGAVAFIFYFNGLKEKEAQSAAEKHAASAIYTYNTAIWSRYSAEVTSNPASPYLSSLGQESKRFFENQPIKKVTIFSTDVARLYYGSGNDYVTKDGTERVTLFSLDKVIAGGTVSQVWKDVYLTGSSAPTEKHSFVQMILPLKNPTDGKTNALAEVYVDTGAQWDKLSSHLRILIGAFVAVFSVLIVVMVITASRAEGIITKQHEVNLELIAAAAQAEAQSRDKSQFLASVSHELRTPLNAIIGFSDIVRSEGKDKLDKVHQEYLDDINASGKHLLSLINDILDFSKAEAGKLQIEWAETDATKVIKNSLRMVLPRAEAAQVTLVEDIPPQHLVVVTDAKKLKQVLLNLLSNAVKFTPAGGQVSCSAWVDVVTGALSLQVRDTGIGIAPKDISRVMTPFGQVDSALSRKYEGTGLGLPLSKKFVESMGGTFTIESELKKGTSVTITVPKAPPGWGTAAMNDYSNTNTQSTSHVTPEQA